MIVIFNLIGGGSNAASKFPEFTYTGNYELIDDGLAADKKTRNWRIKFLTSGVLNFTNISSAIDVFLVGGGGTGGQITDGLMWGGGGGYTTNQFKVGIGANHDYDIVIGAGDNQRGVKNTRGGTTSAFGFDALGGWCGTQNTEKLAYGGSAGGRPGAYDANGGQGGSDGSDSGPGGWTNYGTAKGQGTTTRAFAEPDGELYSGGGGGFPFGLGGDGGGGDAERYGAAPVVQPNTGAGGGASQYGAAYGASGIVIIRNSRTA